MRNFTFLIVAFLLFSCKQSSDTGKSTQVAENALVSKQYPENISKIFNAHGGLANWNSMQSLVFTIGEEVTTTNLINRKSLIETPEHRIGYNGKDVWLQNKDTLAYKGNAKFYYNLMFYFYAMPFVLADDGINYEDVNPLVFEGKSYPGIKVSYNSGVGESPDDEYILYYDPETYNMSWLAYTVTYFSKEKSKAFRFIKYNDWENIEGLLLPERIVWYNYEDHVPTTKRNDRKFSNVKISKEAPDATIFEVPEGAEVIK